jgi:hypothetical protein
VFLLKLQGGSMVKLAVVVVPIVVVPVVFPHKTHAVAGANAVMTLIAKLVGEIVPVKVPPHDIFPDVVKSVH